MRKSKKKKVKAIVGEGVYRSARTFKKYYQVYQGSMPHGHSAEALNHLADQASGKKATILHQQLLNGPDRIIETKGKKIYLQTKFCKTSARTTGELFHDNKYRYVKDGKAFPTEVPSCQYDAVVKKVAARILKGQVAGYSKASDAKKIIRKSPFSYKQAVSATKSLTPESLLMDTATVSIASLSGASISMILTYVFARKNGATAISARDQAAKSAVKTFSTQLLSHVLTQQVSRTSFIRMLSRPSLYVAMKMPVALRNGLAVSIGSTAGTVGAIGGVGRLIQGGIIGTAVTTLVMSLNDLRKFFTSELSARELVRNVVIRVAGIAGASVGNFVGRAIFCLFGIFNPFLGIIGGLIGSAVGVYIAGGAAKSLVELISPDREQHYRNILNDNLSKACTNFGLNAEELDSVVLPALRGHKHEDVMKQMYEAQDPQVFAWRFSTRLVADSIATSRKRVGHVLA